MIETVFVIGFGLIVLAGAVGWFAALFAGGDYEDDE